MARNNLNLKAVATWVVAYIDAARRVLVSYSWLLGLLQDRTGWFL
jgi:hypothetical protein